MGTAREGPDALPPARVAERLGISTAQLRKYAPIYEELFGPLPRDARERRVYPREAVVRLEAARALIREGKAESIRGALEQLKGGALPEVGRAELGGLEQVVEELRRIREVLEAHQERLTRLEQESRSVQEVLKQLEGTNASLEVARLDPWEEVRAGLRAVLRGLRRVVRRRFGRD